MVAGVYTEKKIVISPPVIFSRKQKNHPKFTKLVNLYENLTTYIFKRESSSTEDQKIYFD